MSYFLIKCKQFPTRAVLPLSIEQDMARLLSSGSTSSSATGRKMLSSRRAKSLDSIVIVDSEPPSPRCPSPTPSSGVDSNKDSPIQIENIDGSSIGMYGLSLCNIYSTYNFNVRKFVIILCEHFDISKKLLYLSCINNHFLQHLMLVE